VKDQAVLKRASRTANILKDYSFLLELIFKLFSENPYNRVNFEIKICNDAKSWKLSKSMH